MGVVNVTPDSFSDGGRWFEPAAAVEHGLALLGQGADLLDVGGESTRPGAERPTEREELDRVIPVVAALAAQGARISIDTMRSRVAAESLDAGATLINDVSGGLADPQMATMAARSGLPFVAMHWRAHSAHMHREARYADVVTEVVAELLERVEALVEAGVAREAIILDPGFGFSKDAGHNWELLAGLDQVTALPHPVLVGTSRKRFLGRLGAAVGSTVGPAPSGEPTPSGALSPPTPPAERDAATAATSLLAAQAGAWAVRVHDVPGTRDALAVWAHVHAAGGRA
ncbi:dihydropteroate synthase [Ornithinimicrobium cryptoxanthini]|uniref:dihydropteroate synthase n=1 Tax=Ornithinimicrobium cryptoxanthini TaxID=2934161 RepID=A0ABY4YIV0_9MICO|nr:dihydropteroate synthase [Ornithinimicrobium cryptoxanthini]USQ76720.1 dihydropteroate synthase [Ornithinimicrobium cryptoxanthini]